MPPNPLMLTWDSRWAVSDSNRSHSCRSSLAITLITCSFARINKCFRCKCSRLEYFAFSTCNLANSWDTNISKVNISLWSHAILHVSTNASDTNAPNLNILLLVRAMLQMLEIPIFQISIFHFDHMQFCTYQQMLQIQMFQTWIFCF